MSAWLTALLGRVLDAGVAIPLGYGLNFTSGVRARLNTSTKFIDVDVRPSSIGPTHLAAEDAGVGAAFVMRVVMTAGTPGTADDVTGPAAPVDCIILDRWVDIDVAQGGSSLRVRDTAGGAGASLSGQISTAATGEGIRSSTGAGTTVSARRSLLEGEVVHVRRTDRGVAGTVYLLCERTA